LPLMVKLTLMGSLLTRKLESKLPPYGNGLSNCAG
jgi:hypothetical protein